MNHDLFQISEFQPLAARMRPKQLNEFFGQRHLMAPDAPFHRALTGGKLHSMILWGPPGTGKTTLAHLIAQQTEARFESMSAVLAGVKDIREMVATAKAHFGPTILFIDEIHRFNKSQQDALLPHVEEGTVTLIGATTENPSFELNNALLSRARVYVLKRLTENDLLSIIDTAVTSHDRGLGDLNLEFAVELREQLAKLADGDARYCLNMLEILSQLATQSDGRNTITPDVFHEACQMDIRRFDKGGDIFYDQISALHKSVRGSDPDASLYWLCRMLDGGCDPLYIARRVVRMATEDIGNADPRGLTLAMAAWDAQTRLGSPEGELALAQAVVYLAVAAKSNAVYTAMKGAMAAVKQYGSLDVPPHLRNAPTSLMKAQGYGKDYRYAHDEADGFAAGVNYFPDDMPQQQFYAPVDRGLEIQIRDKLAKLRAKNESHES